MKKSIIFAKNQSLQNEIPKDKQDEFLILNCYKLLFSLCLKGRVVITDYPDLINELYAKGAEHIYFGKGFYKELLRQTQNPYKDFFQEFYQTDSLKFQEDIHHGLSSLQRETPVLITGESGSGKTFLAKKLHQYLFPGTPFVAKNLCELSPQIIESELFGHKKGSYTGAEADHKGLLSLANGGTLFLDEIGALPQNIQKKLLKVLDEREFSPMGSTKKEKLNINLITATCEDLQELKSSGDFRTDFFYRISGYQLEVPPLRERPNDIELFLSHLQEGYSRKLYFTPNALTEIKAMNWEGNHRELKSYYERLQRGKISRIESLVALSQPPKPKNNDIDLPLGGLPELLREMEDLAFNKAMKENHGRPNYVCSDLKISKSVFYRLQTRYKEREATQIS